VERDQRVAVPRRLGARVESFKCPRRRTARNINPVADPGGIASAGNHLGSERDAVQGTVSILKPHLARKPEGAVLAGPGERRRETGRLRPRWCAVLDVD